MSRFRLGLTAAVAAVDFLPTGLGRRLQLLKGRIVVKITTAGCVGGDRRQRALEVEIGQHGNDTVQAKAGKLSQVEGRCPALRPRSSPR